ncbi:MAG: extensin family protein [Polyangiales bacterium]
MSRPFLAMSALVGGTLAGCAALGGPRKHAQKPQSATVAAEPAPAPTSRELETAGWPATPVKPATPISIATTPPPETPPPAPTTVSTPVALSGNTALEYAALSGSSCLAELKKRGIAFTPVDSALGVDQPVRIAGLIHGVDVHGLEPKAKRATSPYEVLDCRLLLALDDFTRILAQHDVVEAVHMSMYRPPAKLPKDPKRHDAAMAIDLGFVVKKDGSKLSVLDHWHGYIGAKTCGNGAGPSPATKEATEIRQILCAAADAKLFNVVLTPNYNKPHQNHFHLEVTRGVKWFIVN